LSRQSRMMLKNKEVSNDISPGALFSLLSPYFLVIHLDIASGVTPHSAPLAACLQGEILNTDSTLRRGSGQARQFELFRQEILTLYKTQAKDFYKTSACETDHLSLSVLTLCPQCPLCLNSSLIR